VPRPTREGRQQQLAETQARLLTAAAEEFARAGYTGANINHISEAAGFAKGTVYNYFPSKRALLNAVIDHVAAEHTTFVQAQMEAEPDPAARLTRLFAAGFAFVEQHRAPAQVIINVVYGPDAEFKERVYQAYDPLFNVLIRDTLQAGVACGAFRPLDPDTAAAVIMAIYLGGCSQVDAMGKIWLDPGQVSGLILDGLRAPEGRPARRRPSGPPAVTRSRNKGGTS